VGYKKAGIKQREKIKSKYYKTQNKSQYPNPNKIIIYYLKVSAEFLGCIDYGLRSQCMFYEY
jgi:hypothetical protein